MGKEKAIHEESVCSCCGNTFTPSRSGVKYCNQPACLEFRSGGARVGKREPFTCISDGPWRGFVKTLIRWRHVATQGMIVRSNYSGECRRWAKGDFHQYDGPVPQAPTTPHDLFASRAGRPFHATKVG